MNTLKSSFYLRTCLLTVSACLAMAPALAQNPDTTPSYTQEQIQAGSQLYEANCSACHGVRLADTTDGGVTDLRKYTIKQRSRFINYTSNGKNGMPPYRSVLSPEEIENLFAYVALGEKQP